MEPFALLVLALTALASSVLSAIVGMAGGITLLAVMLLFLDPLVAIPLHGVIQLFSNGSRTYVQRRHVDWSILARYCVLLVPMGLLGLSVARSIPPDGLRLAIGGFVLVATWVPSWLVLGLHPERTDPRRRFLLLGGAVGFLQVTVGAVGPLIAPFFLNLGLPRQGVIGSKAACQTAGHLVKIGIFGLTGFAFAGYTAMLALLCAAVVVGTWLGSRILDRVSEVWFVRLYQGVLSVIAAGLVIGSARGLLGLR